MGSEMCIRDRGKGEDACRYRESFENELEETNESFGSVYLVEQFADTMRVIENLTAQSGLDDEDDERDGNRPDEREKDDSKKDPKVFPELDLAGGEPDPHRKAAPHEDIVTDAADVGITEG